jgi:uncharacterized membrane protein
LDNKKLGLGLTVAGIAALLVLVSLVYIMPPGTESVMMYYHRISLLFTPIFIIMIAFGFYLFLKTEKSARKKTCRTYAQEILTDDERAVVAELKKKDNITQAQLREKLDFSKAKLSMMLEKMQTRGLVKKIKTGKTNFVILKKKI